MRDTFLKYLSLRENTTENGQIKKASSEVKLADDSDFKPFLVDSEHHPNLRLLVQAFLDSDKVALPGPEGFPSKLTILDKKGEQTPKLKKKTLYLVGGAVRDHLLGKTPRNYNLVTDATPDEIRLTLKAANFTEAKPQSKGVPMDKKYDKHPEAGNKSKTFFAQGWDRAGKEYTFTIKINGEEFELSTLRKDAKGKKSPDHMEFGGLEDDASKRDFTVNSMYIPLTSADGPNAKLIDPHGGAHHLRAGEIKFIGNPKERVGEDQGRILRMIRQIASHGKNTKIGDDVKAAISDVKDLPDLDRDTIRDEFLRGLEHPDTDPTHYVKLHKDLGLLNTVFPDVDFKLDDPKDFSDKKEKRLAIAWLLRNNNPAKIESALKKGNWSNKEIKEITHLIEIANWMKKHKTSPELFFNDFFKIKSKLHEPDNNLVPSLIRQWGRMNELPEDILNKFLTHDLSTKGFIKDDFGNRSINPEIVKVLGRMPQGQEFSDTIKKIETDKFRKTCEKKDETCGDDDDDGSGITQRLQSLRSMIPSDDEGDEYEEEE